MRDFPLFKKTRIGALLTDVAAQEMRVWENKPHGKQQGQKKGTHYNNIKPPGEPSFWSKKPILNSLPPVRLSLCRKQIRNVQDIYLLCAGNIPDADAWAATCCEATRAAEVKPNGEKM